MGGFYSSLQVHMKMFLFLSNGGPYCMAGLFVNDLRVVASLRLKQLQMELLYAL